MKSHRKGSVARAIQEYFLTNHYEEMLKGKCDWCWFAIPNNPEFCVGLDWQAGYDESDKAHYGKFMQGEFVVNVSIRMTDEFAINGEYACYAEYYYLTDEELSGGLMGGCSLTQRDFEQGFYEISHFLAREFNQYNRKKSLALKQQGTTEIGFVL